MASWRTRFPGKKYSRAGISFRLARRATILRRIIGIAVYTSRESAVSYCVSQYSQKLWVHFSGDETKMRRRQVYQRCCYRDTILEEANANTTRESLACGPPGFCCSSMPTSYLNLYQLVCLLHNILRGESMTHRPIGSRIPYHQDDIWSFEKSDFFGGNTSSTECEHLEKHLSLLPFVSTSR